MPLQPVRVGLVGCGRIVRLAHLQSLLANREVRVVATADPDPASREWAASRVPDAKHVESPAALIDLENLDAVVIAVPAPLHREVAERSFARGLHVYLEKPIATNVTDAEAIAAAWKKSGTVGRIGFNCRFNPLYRRMRELIGRGDIGEPVAVRSALTARWPQDATWRLSPGSGGGGLLELASHHVDLLRFLFDAEVRVVGASSWSNRGTDEAAMLQLCLTSGLHAQTLVCYGTVEEDRFEVYGTDAKLVIDRYNSLVVERTPAVAAGGIGTALRRAREELSALPYGLRKSKAPGQEPSFAASLDDFIETVQTGRAASPSIDDGVASLRVIESARALAGARRDA